MNYYQSPALARIKSERRKTKARSIANFVMMTVTTLALLDLVILFASLAQIAFEGRTRYWAPFWAAQARFVISLFN